MRPVPIMPSRGVNLFDAPEALGPDECRKAKNLVPVPLGKLSKRGGLARPVAPNPTMREGSGLNVPSAAVICPFKASNSTDDIDMVVAWRGRGRIYLAGWAATGTVGSFAAPFDHPRVPMLAWNNRVYALPGPYAIWSEDNAGGAPPSGPSQAPFYVYDNTMDGVFVTAAIPIVFAGTGNDNVFPSIAVPYKQRLVLMNFGAGRENTIVFTDNFTADVVGDDVLASNGRAISLVAGADGDEIVAGIEVMLTATGTPAESGLLILRKYGNPFLLTGDLDQTTGGTSTLSIQRISINCGCAGPYTVVKTPYGIVWAGVDDVWTFREGVIPYQVGTKIQPALKLTPNQLQYRWSAAYFDGFYRLAVWGEGQSLAETSAPGDQWWLDLRDGPPRNWREVRWWGPQQFLGGATAGVAPSPATWGMVPESRAGKAPKLYYLDYALNSGGQSTVVGEYGSSPRDTTSPVADIADKDYVDAEVEFELVTPEVVLRPPYLQMNDGIAFNAHPSSNIQLNADFVLDDGEYKYTTTKYMTAEGFLTGSTRLGVGKPFKKTQRVGMYPSNRRAAIQNRFKLYDQAGWSILTGYNDLFIYSLGPWDGTQDQRYATVPQGLYTIATLVAALNAAPATLYDGTSLGTHSTDLDNYGLSPWQLSSGLVTTDDGPSPGTATFTIHFDDNTGASNAFATEAQRGICRRLGAILGFATGANKGWAGDGGTPNTETAATAPFKKGVARVELYGLQANFEVIPRNP